MVRLWWRMDPLTRKRFARFRRIKRGYYSFLILTVLFVISLFSEYVANNRAILVWHDHHAYFPTSRPTLPRPTGAIS